jgi:hypothetical protein
MRQLRGAHQYDMNIILSHQYDVNIIWISSKLWLIRLTLVGNQPCDNDQIVVEL